mmetsp:Transcript_3798/g.8364  ORF Transcript_3798/g.8364 Transcript_3798/m.8364 type:complete len:218 (+) Transcript_3798:1665-2318(+)
MLRSHRRTIDSLRGLLNWHHTSAHRSHTASSTHSSNMTVLIHIFHGFVAQSCKCIVYRLSSDSTKASRLLQGWHCLSHLRVRRLHLWLLHLLHLRLLWLTSKHSHLRHLIGRRNTARRRWTYQSLLLSQSSHHALLLQRGTTTHLRCSFHWLSPRLPQYPRQTRRQSRRHPQPLLRNTHDQMHRNCKLYLIQLVIHRIITHRPDPLEMLTVHTTFAE